MICRMSKKSKYNKKFINFYTDHMSAILQDV